MKLCVFLCVLSIFSSAISNEASKEEMAVHELLVNRGLILTFVSHPKTQEFFMTQQQKQDEFYRSHDTEMQVFLKQYPDSKEARWMDWPHTMQIANFKILHKEIVIPFLRWGVANLYGIEDSKLVGDLQEFQVRLFANFLSREGILLGDETLEADLIDFCREAPLPLISQVIGPLVSWEVESVDSDGNITIGKPWDEIINFYAGEDVLGKNVSYDQKYQLECIFNPLGDHCQRLKWRQKYSTESSIFQQIISQELQSLLEEAENLEENDEYLEKTLDSIDPATAVIEKIFKDGEDFFPKERILSLFFEVMEECYPEFQDTFFQIKQNAAKS